MERRASRVPWCQIVGLRNLPHGNWVIDTEELRDVARNKAPERLAVLRPELDRG